MVPGILLQHRTMQALSSVFPPMAWLFVVVVCGVVIEVGGTESSSLYLSAVSTAPSSTMLVDA